MFEYHDNRLAVRADWLYEKKYAGIISRSNYDKLVNVKIMKDRVMNVLVPPAPGRKAWIEYESIKEDIKRQIEELVGDPYKLAKRKGLENLIQWDTKGFEYFSNYIKKGGHRLTEEKIREYTWNASVLWALGRYVQQTQGNRKTGKNIGITKLWQRAADMLAVLDTRSHPHTLPLHWRRVRGRHDKLVEFGYSTLVHGNEGNINSLKVDEKLERLILSLYCLKNRPFASVVRDMYLQFLGHGLDVADGETGEMFNPDDFYKDGEPITISDSTVWGYINATENQDIIAKMTKSSIDYNTLYRPHVHRHRGEFALSKISMDDRTIPELDTNGERVTAYYAYDVTSEVFLGAAYGEPGFDIIFECFRDMYRTVKRHGLVWPAQVEVERHLMTDITDVLEGLFGHVRICNPANSREKRAEHAIRSLKYGTEKKRTDRGRFYGRGIYRLPQEKEKGKTKQKKFPREVIIANNRADVELHNSTLHSDQKRFPGKTRWEVLLENQGDYAAPVDHLIMKNIGFRTETSIRNRDYVRVQYANYAIESFDMLDILKANNYKVEAYWMPAEGGGIPEVYLFQGENYIGKATKAETFNEAMAERTEHDEEIRLQQAKRAAHYDKRVKEKLEKKIAKLHVSEPLAETDETVEQIPEPVAVETGIEELVGSEFGSGHDPLNY